MPSLVALELDIRVYHDDLDAYYRLLSSLGKHVPQLRRVALATYSVTDIELWKIKFPWTQITELVIPLDYVVSCQQLLTWCPDLKMLKDDPHLSRYDRVKETSNIPGLQAVVSHSKLSFIDMSPSLAITLLDHIRCPALARLSLPCPRANQSDGEVSPTIHRALGVHNHKCGTHLRRSRKRFS
ncbi:hypothetical protein BDZ89DRAFT_605228 [Hymenopellis radicata]|nr:hypothetical protein BDZ89DRAFT_605228 [Hymenopellis radicata]